MAIFNSKLLKYHRVSAGDSDFATIPIESCRYLHPIESCRYFRTIESYRYLHLEIESYLDQYLQNLYGSISIIPMESSLNPSTPPAHSTSARPQGRVPSSAAWRRCRSHPARARPDRTPGHTTRRGTCRGPILFDEDFSTDVVFWGLVGCLFFRFCLGGRFHFRWSFWECWGFWRILSLKVSVCLTFGVPIFPGVWRKLGPMILDDFGLRCNWWPTCKLGWLGWLGFGWDHMCFKKVLGKHYRDIELFLLPKQEKYSHRPQEVPFPTKNWNGTRWNQARDISPQKCLFVGLKRHLGSGFGASRRFIKLGQISSDGSSPSHWWKHMPEPIPKVLRTWY